MNDLGGVRKRFMLWLGVLASINLALLVYLLWPGSGGPNQQTLQAQYANLSHEVAQWQSSNPDQTRKDLQQLYQDIPVRWSQISSQLDKMKADTGVASQTSRYSTDSAEKTPIPNIQIVKVETTVTGEYGNVARFINAMEQSKMLFIVEKVSLSSHDRGSVALQITFDTFVRNEA